LIWGDRLAVACASCPALAAAYESPDGRLALLLTHTMLPLPEERDRWREQTTRAAARIVSALRAAGLPADTPCLVAQLRAFDEVAEIVERWTCRYVGDAERHRELAWIVRRFVADVPPSGRASGGPSPVTVHTQTALAMATGAAGPISAWYDDMAPCWLSAEPAVRRTLMLRAHRFIAERLLLPLSQGAAIDPAALAPGGPLARLLIDAVPLDEIALWRPWIWLVLSQLRRAMAWPVGRRDRKWARWLFLIPYRVPVPRPLTRQSA
jgi:hypothetical protein